MLSRRCAADSPKAGDWPPAEWLQELQDNVMLLISPVFKKPPMPVWKTFLLVDKRMPSLRLVQRVNNLLKRALARVAGAGESALSKLMPECECNEAALNLLCDIERLTEDLSKAKAIDWKRHEGVLKSLSGAGVLRLACGDFPASPSVICYARVLEMLVDDCWRDKARPLIEWAVRVGHPEAKNLCKFDYDLRRHFETEESARRTFGPVVWTDYGYPLPRKFLRQKKTRERVRRHRIRRERLQAKDS
jgi:hypothetical protein